MFDKKLFQEKIEPRCVYCAKGADLGGDHILCAKRGVVAPTDSCRAFRYDPLKRTPPKPVSPDFSHLEGQDFSL